MYDRRDGRAMRDEAHDSAVAARPARRKAKAGNRDLYAETEKSRAATRRLRLRQLAQAKLPSGGMQDVERLRKIGWSYGGIARRYSMHEVEIELLLEPSKVTDKRLSLLDRDEV